MKNKNKAVFSRRKFLGASLLGAAGLTTLPGLSYSQQETKESMGNPVKIRLGFIGLGRQSNGIMRGMIQLKGVEVLAGADVYGVKRQRFEKYVNEFYVASGKEIRATVYEDYKELLAREDIDAIVIASPDHWHALMAIDACKANKDIYLEKPLTLTIKEGQELVKAVRENNVVLAVGSQQRSGSNFQHAVRMVQKGRIGKISKVFARVGGPPKPYDLPAEPVPSDLNWEKWLGPLPKEIHYNHELNPPISLDPAENEKIWGAWRWYKETGGGVTTDWGAHMFDIAQWAIGMDRSGPVEVIPPGHEGAEFLTFKYANGIIVTEEAFDEKETSGCKFVGEDGWIEVSRGHYKASDPGLYPPEVAQREDLSPEERLPHYANFIESMTMRKDPIVPVEVGHSTCVVCSLGNIAYELDRPIKWDPSSESFVNDHEATQLLHRTYHNGYTL